MLLNLYLVSIVFAVAAAYCWCWMVCCVHPHTSKTNVQFAISTILKWENRYENKLCMPYILRTLAMRVLYIIHLFLHSFDARNWVRKNDGKMPNQAHKQTNAHILEKFNENFMRASHQSQNCYEVECGDDLFYLSVWQSEYDLLIIYE